MSPAVLGRWVPKREGVVRGWEGGSPASQADFNASRRRPPGAGGEHQTGEELNVTRCVGPLGPKCERCAWGLCGGGRVVRLPARPISVRRAGGPKGLAASDKRVRRPMSPAVLGRWAPSASAARVSRAGVEGGSAARPAIWGLLGARWPSFVSQTGDIEAVTRPVAPLHARAQRRRSSKNASYLPD
jgi:hypothetical protein